MTYPRRTKHLKFFKKNFKDRKDSKLSMRVQKSISSITKMRVQMKVNPSNNQSIKTGIDLQNRSLFQSEKVKKKSKFTMEKLT